MLSLILMYLFLLIPPDKAYEGARLHDEGDYDRAAELYREALEESPNDWTVIYNLGVVLYEKNEPESAAVLFDSIISQDSALFEMKSDILYNAGTSYLKATQNCQDSTCQYLEKAIERLVKSLILNPFDDECRRNLEIALRMKNDNQSDQQDQNQQDQNQEDQNPQDSDQSDQQDQNNQSDQQDQKDQNPQDSDQSDQQDQNNQSDQNDQNNQSDQQDQNQEDSDQSNQNDQNNQSGQNETPPMTREQAERILDAALNSPGQDSLLPQDDGKAVPSGQW